MKQLFLFILLFSLRHIIFCQTLNSPPDTIYKEAFGKIIESNSCKGSILIYDIENNRFYSNDFKRSQTGYLPASTFKIPNSIIALESGVIKNENEIIPWDGKKRSLTVWEKDMRFYEAFRFSCVPCYQDIARKVGYPEMCQWLKKLNYGHMLPDSGSLDVFWLEGDFKITAFEQIDFLIRFYFSELPIRPETEISMRKMMKIEETETYTLSGKTGWVLREGMNLGWFVGYLEKAGNVWFVATNIEPGDKDPGDAFPELRLSMSLQAFQNLGVISE